MGRIVAIAGGDLNSTEEINKHMIKLTNKPSPNVLFIGTASRDDEDYIEKITTVFNRLGCEVKALCLCSKEYDDMVADELLSRADLIYVGGGDTIFMVDTWKKYGLDKKLKQIFEADSAVLSGLSAGASCWFNCGHSDSESFQKEDDWSFCWANEMLDIIHIAFCPHYDEEGRDSFDEMLRTKSLPGLAMENNTAFVENNGRQYFIRSSPDATAYSIKYTDNVMEKHEVEFEKDLIS